VLSYAGHSGQITALAVTRDGRYVVSASHDQTLHLWELATGRMVARFTGDGPLAACAIFPDGSMVVAGEASGAMHFLRVDGAARETAKASG
jgi:WD40 repeat protein